MPPSKIIDKDAEDKIREQAVIYQKESKHSLTEFQKLVNQFAGDIALGDSALLSKRGELLEAAKTAVYDSGYNFKKGRSRSKRFPTHDADIKPKRAKFNQEVRTERISQLEEEVKGLDERIGYKEKRVFAATNIKNFKLCDELTEEIMALKSKRYSILQELKQLQQKEKRSKAYKVSHSSSLLSHTGSSDDDVCQEVGTLRKKKSTTPTQSSTISPSSSPSYPISTCSTPSTQSPSIPHTPSNFIHPYSISSTCSTPSFHCGSPTPSKYTNEEILLFERRYEEGFDNPKNDQRYSAWVQETYGGETTSPNMEVCTSQSAQMPNGLNTQQSSECTEVSQGSQHSCERSSSNSSSSSSDSTEQHF